MSRRTHGRRNRPGPAQAGRSLLDRILDPLVTRSRRHGALSASAWPARDEPEPADLADEDDDPTLGLPAGDPLRIGWLDLLERERLILAARAEAEGGLDGLDGADVAALAREAVLATEFGRDLRERLRVATCAARSARSARGL